MKTVEVKSIISVTLCDMNLFQATVVERDLMSEHAEVHAMTAHSSAALREQQQNLSEGSCFLRAKVALHSDGKKYSKCVHRV